MTTSLVSGGRDAERRRLDAHHDDQDARLRAHDVVIASEGTAGRPELLALLAIIRKDLHTRSGTLGGLSRLTSSNPDDFPPHHGLQDKARHLKPLAMTLLQLEQAAKDDTLVATQVRQLALAARALLDNVSTHHAAIRDEKLRVGAVTLQAVGLDSAVDDLGTMLAESATMKITDAPNPYYGMDHRKFARLGLPTEMSEMYSPAHRYIHIDGDERVNGAKTAAARSARDQIGDIDEDTIRARIRATRGAKIKRSVLKRDGEQLRSGVMVDQMMDWYKSDGADLLTALGIPALADIIAQMRTEPQVASGLLSAAAEDNPDLKPALDRLTAAATVFYNDVQEDGFDEGAFNVKVDALIEKQIDLDIGREKGKIVEDQLMTVPDYWVKLGEMALSAEYGRCFSCAGVAIFQLVKNPKFDGCVLESVGAVNYDHHFVLVNRDNVGSSAPPGPNTLVVDIWQANQGSDPPMVLWKDFTYNKETELKVFCQIPAGDRSDLRARCGLD
jgi:hypothetical protein